ncbi:hypothetical protein FB446DRAFT_722150 [Lentinula raphanica]|nr:hypothetical protein FB446DRAFT_722150 [Lentinula raphanica]
MDQWTAANPTTKSPPKTVITEKGASSMYAPFPDVAELVPALSDAVEVLVLALVAEDDSSEAEPCVTLGPVTVEVPFTMAEVEEVTLAVVAELDWKVTEMALLLLIKLVVVWRRELLSELMLSTEEEKTGIGVLVWREDVRSVVSVPVVCPHTTATRTKRVYALENIIESTDVQKRLADGFGLFRTLTFYIIATPGWQGQLKPHLLLTSPPAAALWLWRTHKGNQRPFSELTQLLLLVIPQAVNAFN